MSWLTRAFDGPGALRRWGWASVVANAGLVVTGGAVRLTGSGLGCPTWPRCTEDSYVPHEALDIHSAIEFGNRMLTFVLAAVAIGTFLAAWRSGRRDMRILALIIGLAIPAQAVVGGITVLTDLNPWVVAFHLLCSMAIVSLATVFVRRVDRPASRADGLARRSGALSGLAWTTYGAAWLMLYAGTVVTGAGPHAGDDRARRNGLDPLQVSQLHADTVFLFIGLAIGLAFALRAARLGAWPRRASVVLLAVTLAQGAVGFVQYFTGLPELLVGVHMLGAALLTAAVTDQLLAVLWDPEPSPAD